MNATLDSAARTWSAETAIEDACGRAEHWYRRLRPFPRRVNLGSATGFKYPELVSEQDCVIHFARFLNESGVPWDAIHHQVSVSRWLFDGQHPGATAATPGTRRWRVDLALLRREDFLAANLPALDFGFQFDAFLEFAYLSDYWKLKGANRWGDPAKGREKVRKDVEKIGRYHDGGVCRVGYVIVFEECDCEFSPSFATDAELEHRCKVRFVRGYPPNCPACSSEAVLPIVWGMPGPELQQLQSEGKVILGGCLVHGDDRDPQWECQRCRYQWRS